MTKKKLPPAYKIGIIGSGKMGRDILDFLRDFPFQIYLICETLAEVEFQNAAFQKKIKRAKKYGLIDDQTFQFQNEHTLISADLKVLADCNLVIEAIPEDFGIKRKLFQDLEGIISSACVVASNTSSISPDHLFAGLQHAKNCMGLHFFFPVAMKDWVEMNLPENTSEQSIQFVQGFIEHIGKKYLLLEGNNHFLINRIFLKMQATCCQILIKQKMKIEEIDKLVKNNLFPVGVFEFFDHVGIDVMLQSVMAYSKFENHPDHYQPMIQLLKEKQEAGKLGLKTKSGFYTYPSKKDKKNPDDSYKFSKILEEITRTYLDGVYSAMRQEVCSQQEMQQLIMNYMMIEKSPFELAKEIGYTPK